MFDYLKHCDSFLKSLFKWKNTLSWQPGYTTFNRMNVTSLFEKGQRIVKDMLKIMRF